jgi:hypothetical protein
MKSLKRGSKTDAIHAPLVIFFLLRIIFNNHIFWMICIRIYDAYFLLTFHVFVHQSCTLVIIFGSVVVKALCCKPEDRGFKSR